MDALSSAQNKLVPEMSDLLKKRYQILQAIHQEQPIGRRTLSEFSGMTERDIRKETDLLRNQQLIETKTAGMVITEQGEEVLYSLKAFMHELTGITDLAEKLKVQLGIAEVILVPSDSDKVIAVKSQIGEEAARILEKYFADGTKIAVTGGSTMAAIAEELKSEKSYPPMQFIAARGGLGEDVLHQANTIASDFAEKTGGTFKTLYLPDHLSEEAYTMMMKEPLIKEMMSLYDQTDLVVHGIGNAQEMAIRRQSTDEEIERITDGGAVSEAFGYYFDQEGNVVYRIRSAGIQLEQVQKAPAILAVAGGRSKAIAIKSYFKNAPKRTVLVTDEAAAKEILKFNENLGGN